MLIILAICYFSTGIYRISWRIYNVKWVYEGEATTTGDTVEVGIYKAS